MGKAPRDTKTPFPAGKCVKAQQEGRAECAPRRPWTLTCAPEPPVAPPSPPSQPGEPAAPPVPEAGPGHCRHLQHHLSAAHHAQPGPQGKRQPLPPGAATAHLQAPPPPWAGSCSHTAHILLSRVLCFPSVTRAPVLGDSLGMSPQVLGNYWPVDLAKPSQEFSA